MVSMGRRVVPSLLARDVRETIDFYQDVLGFTLTGKWPDEVDPKWVELSRDDVALQFFAEAPVGIPKEPIMSGTLYLYPSDVRELAKEWENRVKFAWGPEVMDYGMREFGIRDCNGYYLAFTEPA